jgi:hypothetical protein
MMVFACKIFVWHLIYWVCTFGLEYVNWTLSERKCQYIFWGKEKIKDFLYWIDPTWHAINATTSHIEMKLSREWNANNEGGQETSLVIRNWQSCLISSTLSATIVMKFIMPIRNWIPHPDCPSYYSRQSVEYCEGRIICIPISIRVFLCFF